MPGATVRVMRYQYAQGERRLAPAGTAQTDDQGQYRVWGLMPGDYYVNAVARNFGVRRPRRTGRPGAGGGRAPAAGGGAAVAARRRRQCRRRRSHRRRRPGADRRTRRPTIPASRRSTKRGRSPSALEPGSCSTSTSTCCWCARRASPGASSNPDGTPVDQRQREPDARRGRRPRRRRSA